MRGANNSVMFKYTIILLFLSEYFFIIIHLHFLPSHFYAYTACTEKVELVDHFNLN